MEVIKIESSHLYGYSELLMDLFEFSAITDAEESERQKIFNDIDKKSN